MAIGTDTAVNFWNANTKNLEEAGGSASVADLAYSLFDATDLDNYIHADDTPLLSGWFQMDSAGTPDAGGFVNVHGRIMNATDVPDTEDTNDSPIPTDNFPYPYLGLIPVKDITTEQFIPFELYLPNTEPGTVWQFGYKNVTGATINAGWSFIVRAKTIGPKA